MYKVLIGFHDLQDGKHFYSVGDKFPRKGKEVDLERIAFLASNRTKHGEPVIREIKKRASNKAK